MHTFNTIFTLVTFQLASLHFSPLLYVDTDRRRNKGRQADLWPLSVSILQHGGLDFSFGNGRAVFSDVICSKQIRGVCYNMFIVKLSTLGVCSGIVWGFFLDKISHFCLLHDGVLDVKVYTCLLFSLGNPCYCTPLAGGAAKTVPTRTITYEVRRSLG